MVYYDLVEKFLCIRRTIWFAERIFLINKCTAIDIEKTCNVGDATECSSAVEESSDSDWSSRVWEDHL